MGIALLMPLEYTTEMKLALDILKVQGYLWTRVRADNSAPLITEGDMICLKRCGDTPKKGDLVALDCRKLFIVQRIVGTEGSDLLTKADHSEKGPHRKSIDEVAGKVVLIKKGVTLLNIGNLLCDLIHRWIVRLSLGRSEIRRQTGFFYRKFFHKLRRSLLKRLLLLELTIGKIYAKHVDPGIQIP